MDKINFVKPQFKAITNSKPVSNEKAEKNVNNKEIKDNTNLSNSPSAIYNQAYVQKVNLNPVMPKSEQAKKNANCIIGGALGDALGRPVERLRTDQMLERYGKEGLRDLATVFLKARITDDTQMTIFTTDGLIKSALKNGKGGEPDYEAIYDSYQNWYTTQTKTFEETEKKEGWVANLEDLYYPVGPGRTCLGSLEKGIMGTLENPVNESAGCGGVMRVAPIGLAYDDPEKAFEVAAKCAVMTHGHPRAYLPAGFFAAVISSINNGKGLEESFNKAMDILKTYDGHEETSSLISKAMELAKTDTPTAEAIESLGYGFSGDEAMAISTYCIFKCPDNLKDALILAINHSGDSDSTGSITGNVLGLYLGTDDIPKEWMERMELKDELTTLANDLAHPEDIKNASEKYPTTKS